MVKFDEDNIVEKGRVGPGQTIGVDLDAASFYHDQEIKDMLAARQDFGDWVKRITVIDHIVKTDAPEPVLFDAEALRRRQLAVGYTLEELELILHPMVEDAQGGDRLDGRRHAARRAVREISRPAPFLPPEFQPGHQPADRQPARDPRDVAEDAARQSRQRAGRGFRAVRPAAARQPGAVHRRVRGDAPHHGRRMPASSTAPSRSRTARAACAAPSSASAARRRRACASAARM